MLRTIQMASAASVFGLLLTLAATVWDGPSAFIRTAKEWAAEDPYQGRIADEPKGSRIALSVTCNDDAASFAICEAPVAQPLQSAVPAILESPAMMPSAIFAENPNATVAGLPSRRCLALVDPHKANDVETEVTTTAASCCGKSEYPVPGAGGAAPSASSCSCDPQECKCT